jgi:hypothetical protein
MFDLIDEDLFADTVAEHFNVLDERYVADICKELLPEIRATFDGAYETRFVIVENETGKPMNANAILTTREAAEEFLKIVGDDKYGIGLLLLDQ